jgi:hypothetical protein
MWEQFAAVIIITYDAHSNRLVVYSSALLCHIFILGSPIAMDETLLKKWIMWKPTKTVSGQRSKSLQYPTPPCRSRSFPPPSPRRHFKPTSDGRRRRRWRCSHTSSLHSRHRRKWLPCFTLLSRRRQQLRGRLLPQRNRLVLPARPSFPDAGDRISGEGEGRRLPHTEEPLPGLGDSEDAAGGSRDWGFPARGEEPLPSVGNREAARGCCRGCGFRRLPLPLPFRFVVGKEAAPRRPRGVGGGQEAACLPILQEDSR